MYNDVALWKYHDASSYFFKYRLSQPMQWREMRRIEQPALTAKSFHWKMIHEYFNVIHLEPKNNSKGSKITTKMSFYVQVWIMNHFFDPPCKNIGDNFFESFDFLSRRAEHYWCITTIPGTRFFWNWTRDHIRLCNAALLWCCCC